MTLKKRLALMLSVVATIGVIATLASNGIDNPDTPIVSMLASFKYFTIQSNIFVIFYFALLLSAKISENSLFKKLIGAVTAYITITFIVFVFMLQSTWHPEGIAQLGNIINHYIVPILTIAFLVFYRKDYNFKMQDLIIWMIYPITYVLFLLLHGVITGDYIYPFFEIDELGITYFLLAFFGIMILFFLISIGEIILTKKKE